MEIFKKKFKIVFVLFLSMFFVHCSSSIDIDDFDDGDLKLTAPNTYDIKFTRVGSETIHYKGSLKDDDATFTMLTEGMHEDMGNVKMLSLHIDDAPLTIIGWFLLDKNSNPYPFNQGPYDEDVGSTILLSEEINNKYMTSKSGALSISKFKIHQTVKSQDAKVHIVSYVLEFSGEFAFSSTGETQNELIYSATGKIVMSPYR